MRALEPAAPGPRGSHGEERVSVHYSSPTLGVMKTPEWGSLAPCLKSRRERKLPGWTSSPRLIAKRHSQRQINGYLNCIYFGNSSEIVFIRYVITEPAQTGGVVLLKMKVIWMKTTPSS